MAIRSTSAANAFSTTLQSTGQDTGQNKSRAAYLFGSQNLRSMQQYKRKHSNSNKAHLSRYPTCSTACRNNLRAARQLTTRRLSHRLPNKEEPLAATPSDNQAGSPPTFATASEAWAACWRGRSGIQAAVMSLLVQSLRRNYYEKAGDGGSVHLCN